MQNNAVPAGSEEFLDDRDVERIYRIKRGTQKSLRSRRLIPFVQIGGRLVRYRRADLDAWIATRLVAVGSSKAAGSR